MKKLDKKVMLGVMTVIMAVSLLGCKAKEPATEDGPDSEQQETEQEDQDEEKDRDQDEEKDTAQDEEKDTEQDAGKDTEEEADPVQLAVYEEAFRTAFTLEVGESRQLKVRTNYDGSLKYKSDNEAVATVDQEGNVTATGAGRVNLTIAAGGVIREVNVVVKESESDTGSGQVENQEENGNSLAAERNTSGQSGIPTEQNADTTTMNVSISTVITNSEDGSSTVIPFEQTIEIDNSSKEDYHIEWQYVLE